MAEAKRTTRARGRKDDHELASVRLTGDRILVRHPASGERTSRGGLLIPATAQPAPKRCIWGDAVAVGPEVRGVRVGDAVLFLPQSGLEVELGGEDLALLRERDVQAVSAGEAADHAPGQYL